MTEEIDILEMVSYARIVRFFDLRSEARSLDTILRGSGRSLRRSAGLSPPMEGGVYLLTWQRFAAQKTVPPPMNFGGFILSSRTER